VARSPYGVLPCATNWAIWKEIRLSDLSPTSSVREMVPPYSSPTGPSDHRARATAKPRMQPTTRRHRCSSGSKISSGPAHRRLPRTPPSTGIRTAKQVRRGSMSPASAQAKPPAAISSISPGRGRNPRLRGLSRLLSPLQAVPGPSSSARARATVLRTRIRSRACSPLPPCGPGEGGMARPKMQASTASAKTPQRTIRSRLNSNSRPSKPLPQVTIRPQAVHAVHRLRTSRRARRRDHTI
jgi:hypothetical protein